jgi:uncharacterized protein (DUF58 family)
VLRYPIQTHSSLPREVITLQWLGGPGTDVHTLPVAEPQRIPAGSSCLELFWTPLQRGAHRPGRLVLSSTAPLGLFICWTRWDPLARQLVYPGRLARPVALASGNPGEAQQQRSAPAQER